MQIAMRGSKLKRNYEDLINVAVSDKLYSIKFRNRDASFLRNGYVMSQLDGEGMRTMERQQEMASKEAYKEHVSKQIATNTWANIHDLRNDSHQEMRTERVEKAVHFDISQDDVPMTQTTGFSLILKQTQQGYRLTHKQLHQDHNHQRLKLRNSEEHKQP